jgi:phosphate-selective porin OprO and OprP
MYKNFTLSLLLILIFKFGFSQSTKTFGKGLLNSTAKDSSWSTKIAFRFQSRYEGRLDFASDKYEDRGRVRRARIKGDGFVFSPKIKYKFEFDMVNGIVLDAVIKWQFAKNTEIWFGQTKLPGNIERVFSSQKLQLVDRSLLNSYFTLDRDAGFQLRNSISLGKKFKIREIISLSQGEGLNQTGYSNGSDLSGRIELLPLGYFSGKGDYFASDLKREDRLKLMLSCTYDYNYNAMRSRGQKGTYLSGPLSDLASIHADFHLKYNGFSMFGEYAKRKAIGTPIVKTSINNNVTTIDEAYYTGWALNLQAGYLFKNNWEIAGRYTKLTPEEIIQESNINEYTIGFSKYVVGHNLKIQGDFGLTDVGGVRTGMCRLQTEFNF